MKSFAAVCIVALGALPVMGLTINEINYDNDGTDNAEYVEIFHPGGGDFTGYDLVLYNGSTRTEYRRVNLGVIPSDGFLVIGYSSTPNVDIVWSVAADAIQNGAPDGMAIVQHGIRVVEFISYEGTFIAANNEANGMQSIDIGVVDIDPDDRTGEVVLQRFPDGTGPWFQTTDGIDAGVYADGTPGYANVPEPATMVLLGLGALMLRRPKNG